MTARIPVLIAGGGPVGLALAVDLGLRGVACTLVERGDGVVRVPKMTQLSTRTMEFCRRWGIAERAKQAGWPAEHPGDFIYVTSMTGYELFRQRFTPYNRQGDLGYTPEGPRQCPQIFFDPILLARAAVLPCVTLHHLTELVSFEASKDGVQVELDSIETGRRTTVMADHLVGCDGFDGCVRKALGVTYEGAGILSYSVSIFFRSRALAELHDNGWGRFYRLVDSSGHWSDLIAIDGHELWRLTLFDVNPEIESDAFDSHGALIRAVGRDFSYEILSVLPWKRRELVASRYRNDRVFLAGDAAHQMSPTGGLGMNTGIGDAVDIGWKLAAMIDGWGGADLLDSYETERRPVAVSSVAASSDTYRYETSLPRHPAITEATHEGASARREFAAALHDRRGKGNEHFHEAVKLSYCYQNSPIVCPDRASVSLASAAKPAVPCQSGARAPHAWIGAGRSTLDLFGQGFVLLRFDRNVDAGAFAKAAETCRVPLQIRDITDTYIAKIYDKP